MNVFLWSLKNNYNAICLLKSATRKGKITTWREVVHQKNNKTHNKYYTLYRDLNDGIPCGIDREEIGNWQYIGDVGI